MIRHFAGSSKPNTRRWVLAGSCRTACRGNFEVEKLNERLSLCVYLYALRWGEESKAEADSLENLIVRFIDQIRVNCELEDRPVSEFEKDHICPLFQGVLKKFKSQSLGQKLLEISRICDMSQASSQTSALLARNQENFESPNKAKAQERMCERESLFAKWEKSKTLLTQLNENNFNKNEFAFNKPNKQNKWVNQKHNKWRNSRKQTIHKKKTRFDSVFKNRLGFQANHTARRASARKSRRARRNAFSSLFPSQKVDREVPDFFQINESCLHRKPQKRLKDPQSSLKRAKLRVSELSLPKVAKQSQRKSRKIHSSFRYQFKQKRSVDDLRDSNIVNLQSGHMILKDFRDEMAKNLVKMEHDVDISKAPGGESMSPQSRAKKRSLFDGLQEPQMKRQSSIKQERVLQGIDAATPNVNKNWKTLNLDSRKCDLSKQIFYDKSSGGALLSGRIKMSNTCGRKDNEAGDIDYVDWQNNVFAKQTPNKIFLS